MQNHIIIQPIRVHGVLERASKRYHALRSYALLPRLPGTTPKPRVPALPRRLFGPRRSRGSLCP